MPETAAAHQLVQAGGIAVEFGDDRDGSVPAGHADPTPAASQPHLVNGRWLRRSGDQGAGSFEIEGFTDIVDFVEQTTSRIWDEKNPGLVAEWYTPTTVVHTSDGDIFGKDRVIESSVQKMAAFPDIKDYVEETIWTKKNGLYLTSMRWTWTARNTGWSVWGPPTGRRVITRGIANCVIRDGRYVEEWVAYDEPSTLRQLGITVKQELSRLGKASSSSNEGVGEVDRLLAQVEPAPVDRGELDDVEFFIRNGMHEIWNRRLLGHVQRHYAENVAYHGPNGRELYGVGDIRHDVLSILAMVPDARMYVDEVYHNVVAGGEVRAAVRWTLVGTHTGPGRYGPPSGRRVRILGISHQRIRDRLVVEEWSVYSELSLLRQMNAGLDSEAATAESCLPDG